MNLARAKNMVLSEGMASNPENSINIYAENLKLIDVDNVLGIDMGVTLDMVEHNLDLLSSLEQSRRDIFLASSRESPKNQEEDLTLEPKDVNDILQDLLSLSKDGDDENMDERLDSILVGLGRGLKPTVLSLRL